MCIRVFRSKSIGVNVFEDRLEIVRYCPLGFSFRLKVIVPFSSIEEIETATVTEETVKNTQCQIYMPKGSECIIINIMCPVRTVEFMRSNWQSSKQKERITYQFNIAV